MLKFIDFICEYHEEEGGTFQDGNTLYDLNKIFDKTEKFPIKTFKVNDLKWIIPDKIASADLRRAKQTDDSVPIIVTKENDKLLVVDGYHRLIKAIRSSVAELPGKFIDFLDLKQTKLKNTGS